MAGEYRGALKVAGSTLKGWLVDAKRPTRRVRFDLIIDGQSRGTFVANRRRLSFVRKKKETVEDTHGFSIPIRRAWITGEQQTIRIEDPSSAALDLSLTAKLGPAPNENFEDHVVSGARFPWEPGTAVRLRTPKKPCRRNSRTRYMAKQSDPPAIEKNRSSFRYRSRQSGDCDRTRHPRRSDRAI